MKEREIKVYIASPYSNGWQSAMVKLQIETADMLMDEGYYPYPPLLDHFQSMYNPRPERDWLDKDFVFLKCCDAVLRLRPVDKNGKEIPSSGADEETALAVEEGIPVFESIEDLNDHFKANSKQIKFTAHFDAEYLKKKYLDLASDV